MERWKWRMVAALSVSVLACADELRCYPGAVEINGVCECPSGTRYARALDACQDESAVLSDGGSGDSSVSAAPAADAQAALDADFRESATAPAMEPAPAPAGSSCSAGLLLCGDTCVDPRNDVKHCGGCGACKSGAFCQNGACVDVGCSDGTREAFADIDKFPELAGCAATWPRSSLRAPRKLARCGNSSAGCEAAVDACATGWHVCGNTESGAVDITSRISQQDCAGQKGRFAAALGDQTCTPCTVDGFGAACCGDDCVQQMGSCLWPMATAWFGVRNGALQLCGAIDNPTVSAAIGVMCCRDGK